LLRKAKCVDDSGFAKKTLTLGKVYFIEDTPDEYGQIEVKNDLNEIAMYLPYRFVIYGKKVRQARAR
jgi:hypothetical protein